MDKFGEWTVSISGRRLQRMIHGKFEFKAGADVEEFIKAIRAATASGTEYEDTPLPEK